MYTDFYGIDKEPFHVTPDPDFLFLSPSHKEALASIIYGIEKRKGFIVITGEVGVGKTTILRYYLEKIRNQKRKIIYIFNPGISFHDLVITLYRELEIDIGEESLFEKLNLLNEAMIKEFRDGYNIVLVIDEAQNMPVETLENLRMLSNLETSTDKLIQIVMVGQPEFEEMLNKSILRQLKQRIAVYSKILPLTPKESGEYIKHRLITAGNENDYPLPFTRGAVKKIIKESRGIPRLINILSDNSLIAGYGYQRNPVNSKIVSEVIADFKGERKSAGRGFRYALAGTLLFLSLAFFAHSMYEKEIASIFVHGSGYLAHAKTTLGSMAESLYSKAGLSAPPAQNENESISKTAEPETQESYRGDINTYYEEAALRKENTRQIDSLSEMAMNGPPPGEIRYFDEKSSETIKVENFSDSPDADKSITDSNPDTIKIEDLGARKFSYPSGATQTPLQKAAESHETGISTKEKLYHVADTGKDLTRSGKPPSLFREFQEKGNTRINIQPDNSTKIRRKPRAFISTPKDDFPVMRIVQEGDYLFKLAEEIYGAVTADILEAVRVNNPGIDDVNLIFIGEMIVFPYIEVSEKEQKHDKNL
ncbi:MAG: AAA family ATPase [Syntrophales bacterium]|jgi:type II secretory pathway predicted ATPase ExeA/phage tail protein X|nr:AAA family ATPase [Syntrophales bacterium]